MKLKEIVKMVRDAKSQYVSFYLFRVAGMTYVSNCAVAMRLDGITDDQETDEKPEARARVQALLDGKSFWDFVANADLSEPKELKKDVCGWCEGSGKQPVYEKCVRCDGSGEILCCECRQSADCPRCDGEGTLPTRETEACEECNGSGHKKTRNPIGQTGLDWRYIEMLRELPGCELQTNDRVEPQWFRFVGGIGCVMPMAAD